MTPTPDNPEQPEQPEPAASASGRGLMTSAGALLVSRLVVAVLGWGGTILIVRGLDAREWGQFSLVFTVLGMLSFVSSLGSARLVLAELDRGDADEAGAYAGSYVVLRGLLGTLAYAAALLFVVVAGYPREVVMATAVGGLVLIISAAGSGLDVVFQSRLRMTPVAMGTVVGQVGQLALTVLVALTRPSLLLFLLPAISYDILATWWKARRVGALLPVRLAVDVKAWWSLLVQAAPLAAGAAFTTIAVSIDLIVLSKVDTFEAVGGLAVADKFFVIVAFVPIAVEAPLVALLVRYWPDRIESFYATMRRGMLIMSLCGGLILVVFTPVAEELISLLYGGEYRDFALAAQLSVLAGCLQFYGYIVLAALVAMARHRAFLLVSLARLVLSLATSLALVPPYSATGAGLSRVVSTVLVLVILGVLVRRTMSRHVAPLREQLLVLALCLIGIGVGVAAAQLLWWPVAMVLGPFTYVSLVELTKVAGPSGLRSLAHDLERE